MTRTKTMAVAAGLGVLATLTFAGPTSASAAVPRAAAPAAATPCKVSANARTTPRWRQGSDTTRVGAADLAALPQQASPRNRLARAAAAVLPSRVTIPVYVHVIKGTRAGERNPAGPRRVAQMIAMLNSGFSGAQSPLAADTRYRFTLKRISYTRNESWYHASLFGPRDVQMKRRLHRGDAHTLNLYVNGGPKGGEPLLGWSRFPWQYAANPKLDSVTVTTASLPGGKAAGYNLGKTVIHETGHWMGLLHTFQNGCSAPGDEVADTPAEAEPSFYCETTRDTCTSPGLDPVHNFMDYSYDSCMNMFTAGQAARIDAAFVKWRQAG